MNFATLAVLASAILFMARRMTVSGALKWLIIACRIVVIGALYLAFSDISYRHVRKVESSVVYLIDGSDSVDSDQRLWISKRIASLESLRPQKLERAIVVFGSDIHMVSPFDRKRLDDPSAIQRIIDGAKIDRKQTNIESALLGTLSVLAPERKGCAILLSDAQETKGSAASVLSYVRRLGLQVFPAPLPTDRFVKTRWDELAVPPVVQLGSSVPIQLVVFSGSSSARRAHVSVLLHGVSVKQRNFALRPGWQVISLSVPTIQRGTMSLDVQLTIPEEKLVESKSAFTEVEGPPRILLVTDTIGAMPALANAIKHRQIDVQTARLLELPAEAYKLVDYDAVLLFNVSKSAVSSDQVNALRQYVESSGAGLVTVGLGGDLSNEIQQASALDELLPIKFEPKGLQEAKRRVCIMLLIDRSASMLGARIAATKRAAVELVKQLSAEDLVGVLAFDTQPYIVAEIQPAGQVGSWLVEKLVKLRSSGGTDVYPALLAASDRLELTGATVKHIILLSDGNTPFQEVPYKQLMESLKLSGITISTIGIGDVFINADYLKWLSKSTGGTFYQMRNLDELPRLIARDTQDSLARLPFSEGYFRPSKTKTTDWFADVAEFPHLRGYLTASAKPNARVDLVINAEEKEEPLLARWSLGRGRVVSFASDADARWSPDWIRWPNFEATWAQVLRFAMRPRFTEELFVWVEDNRGSPRIIVEGFLHDPRSELVSVDGSATFPLSLVQTGTWRWQASLEQFPSGWYRLNLESRQAEKPLESDSVMFAKRWVRIGTPVAEDEVNGQQPNEALLRQIALSTSAVYNEPDLAFLPFQTTASVSEPLMHLLLPIAIIALLIEIALRGSSML